MKEYYICRYDISHPRLGSVIVEVDQSEGIFTGWWRQWKVFSNKLLPEAAGKWIYDNYLQQLQLFPTNTIFGTKPYIVLDEINLSATGARGMGRLPEQNDIVRWRLRKMMKIREYTIQDIARQITDSTWRFVTSEGVNITGGLGKTGVTYNLGSFYIKGDSEAVGKQHKILYSTAGVSAGAGGTPMTISGSTTDMPSGGIGRIFKTKRKGPLSLYDFEGFCTIIEVSCLSTNNPSAPYSGDIAAGGGLYAIFFHSVPLLIPTALFHSTNAFGFMYGSSLGLGVGAGGSLSTGTSVIMS